MDPISSKERIQLLDVLRGFAIFGMFTVNMTVDLMWGDSFREVDLALPDQLAVILVDLFTNGKFITIFSFMFGLGLYIQMERAAARGEHFTAIYIRRLLGLFLIGSIAIIFGLMSIILVDYAMWGLLLIFFYKRSPKFILGAAVILFVVAKIYALGVGDLAEHRELEALALEQRVSLADVEVPADPEDQAEEAALREGSFVDIARAQATRLRVYLADLEGRVYDLDLLALLLLGLYVGRLGVIRDAEKRRELARRVLPFLLGIGFTGCLVFVILRDLGVGDPNLLSHKMIRSVFAWPIGMPVLGLGYAALITLLMDKAKWQRILSPFAAVGRLALTNYIFTNAVIAVIMYSWGLGLYGELMPAAGLLIAVASFTLQVFASRWWMARFRFGPLEWIWRAFTYGHLPPMRLEAAQ